MISLDTNVVLRYLNNDHPTLSKQALGIIEENRCFISRTTLLETYQVLESFYRLKKSQIMRALHTLFAIESITIEDHLNTIRVLAWFEAGMDFADALIAASSSSTDQVATFDKDFSLTAKKLDIEPPVKLFKIK